MNKEQLGEFVKQQRMLKNLTQKEFADKLGKRRQSVIEVENGQCDYGVSVLLAMIEVLGFTLVPTVISTTLPSNVGFNFSLIESAKEEDDPNFQKRKQYRIFAQSHRKQKNQSK